MCSQTYYWPTDHFMAWTYDDDGQPVLLEWSDEAQAFVIPTRAGD